ncbi:MAG: hypothetical protein IJB72_05485 [Clostridia bacterium]|nr:hypothetical protein [Clostridia bacterium]
MIDITYDFRTDSFGKDPDSHSSTLRKYHQILWSKELPNGGKLILDDNLRNISDAGYFEFSSDSIIHTFYKWKRMQEIIKQIPNETIEEFVKLSYTIGGMTIFPCNKVEGKKTINGERGLNHRINDRIDLTLECIRRYYSNEESPMTECLDAYSDFFSLFCDFKGYIDFFFFQDLVTEEYKEIKFLYPFENFKNNSLPKTKEEYENYKNNTMVFINKRSKRIDDWQKEKIDFSAI